MHDSTEQNAPLQGRFHIPSAKFLALFISPHPANLYGMDFTADLRLLYADWPAVDVQWIPQIGPSVSGRAIHDHPGNIVLAGEALTTEHTLRYPLATFPAVKQGDTFVLDGQNYRTTDAPLSTLDGLECIVPLARTGT